MKLEIVTSSNILAVGYDSDSLTMAVQFRGGKIYHYKGVSQGEYNDVRGSGSIGSAFMDIIRHNYEGILQE